MTTTAHAVPSHSGSTKGPGAVSSKAQKVARPKAQWTFDNKSDRGAGDDGSLQMRMEVSQPEDLLEKEADRVAAHVVQASPPAPVSDGRKNRDDDLPQRVQRMASPKGAATKAADEDETDKLHRKATNEDDGATPLSHPVAAKRLTDATNAEGLDEEVDDEVDDGSDLARNANAHASTSVAFDDRLRMARLQGGAPLPHPLRSLFEPRMHTHLDHVRVHVDNEAAGLAQSVKARAFTVGRHVFFGAGQFQPQTQQGQRLIAHELTHVLQQRGGLHSVQREVFESSPRAKDEEDQAQGPASAATERPPRTASGPGETATPAPASAPGEKATQAPTFGPGTPATNAAPKAEASAAKLGEPLMPEPDMTLSAGETTRLADVEASAQGATATQANVPPAEKEVATAKEAAQQPKAEADGQARADVVEKLDQREPPSPEILELCDKIRRVIRAKRPPNEESLVNADPEAMAKEAGREQNNKVQADVDRVGSAYDSVKTTPEGKPAPAAPMPETPAKVPATDIGAPRAVPDDVPAEGMSLDADVSASAKRMDDAGMNTEPAKLVQDGPIAAAREAQGELATKAMEDPAEVAAAQKAALAQANADMAALQEQAQAALAGQREHHVGAAKHGKDTAKKSEEELRKDLSERANGVFSKAQKDVKGLLDPLTDTAMKQWDAGVKQLSTEFKNRLKRVADWIEQRHSGLVGAVVAFGDYIAGLPPWVVEEYDAAEKQFGDGICKLITDISRDVNTVVKACEGIISKARQEITTIYTQDLPASLNSWAADQQQQFGAKLDKLQGDVTATRTDFNKKLVDQAAGAVQEARQQIHDLRQAARGLLGAIEDAIGEFIKDPAKFIINGLLKLVGIPPDAFWAVVAKIQQVVKDIAADPMSFANNLMAGIGQGFQQFFDNIGTHLIKGMLEWLLSGMKDAGLSVAVPKDASMRSVVTFFLELLGISWPRIRKLLVEQLGEKTVAILETAGGIFAAVMTKGISGIWEEIQQMLEPKVIVDAIIDAAIKYIVETVVVKVAARIVMLFNPAGAIAQAIEAIYRVLKWIFNNAARIFRLVEAVVNGMADVIAGNVKGVATMVENALAMLIAPVIDFIADYIGLGGLPAKVADAVKGLQAWVEGILRRVIAWLVTQGKKLLAALGFKEKDKDKDKDKDKTGADSDLGDAIPVPGDGTATHTLSIEVKGSDASLVLHSATMTVEQRLDLFGRTASGPDSTQFFSKPEEKEKATTLIGNARAQQSATKRDADDLVKKMAKQTTKEQESGKVAQGKAALKGEEKALAQMLSELYAMFQPKAGEPEAGLHEVKAKDRESHHVPAKGLSFAIGSFFQDLASRILAGPWATDKRAQALASAASARAGRAVESANPDGKGLSAIAILKSSHTEEGGVHSLSGSGPILQKLAMENRIVVVKKQTAEKIHGVASFIAVNPQIPSWRDFIAEVRVALTDPTWKNRPDARPDRTIRDVDLILKDAESKFKIEDRAFGRQLQEQVVEPIDILVSRAAEDAFVAGKNTVATAMRDQKDGTDDGREKALALLRSYFEHSWAPIMGPLVVTLPEE